MYTNAGQWFKIKDIAAGAGRERRPPHSREVIQTSLCHAPPFPRYLLAKASLQPSPVFTSNYQNASKWGSKYPRMIWNKPSKSLTNLRTSILWFRTPPFTTRKPMNLFKRHNLVHQVFKKLTQPLQADETFKPIENLRCSPLPHHFAPKSCSSGRTRGCAWLLETPFHTTLHEWP